MKKVFLIGDSIRRGYDEFLRDEISDIAETYFDEENCRFAQYTLRCLHEWAKKVCGEEAADVDLVVWNNGLWDVLRLYGDDPLTPIDVYELMLDRVYRRIRLLFPKAKVTFCLTTCVIEDWCKPNFIRRNEDIEAYNEVAKKVMAKNGVDLIDLHAVSQGLGKDVRKDHVHYLDDGYQILAKHISEAVRKELA